MENKNKKALVGNERETREESKHAKNLGGKDMNHGQASKEKSVRGEHSPRKEEANHGEHSRKADLGKDKSKGHENKHSGLHDKSKAVK